MCYVWPYVTLYEECMTVYSDVKFNYIYRGEPVALSYVKVSVFKCGISFSGHYFFSFLGI